MPAVMKNGLLRAPRVLVLIPQWAVLGEAERAWFASHPLEGGGAEPAEAVERTERTERAEREVLGRVRTRRQMQFSLPGPAVEYEVAPEGTEFERLKPDKRDEHDQKVQHDLDGRQLVVVRWQGRAVLVFGSDIEEVV